MTALGSVPRGSASTLRRNPAAAWRHLDLALVGCVGAVSCLGALMVYSATRGPGGPEPYDATFLEKQAMYVVAGFLLMAIISLVDYRIFREWAIVLYGASSVLLALVVSPLGSNKKGAQAWFQFGPFQMQPSEFAKLTLIVGLAALAAQFRNEIDLRRLAGLLAVAGVPLALIMLQPDLGTALVLVAITAAILLVGGAQPRHLVALVALVAVGATLVLNTGVLEEYQKCRLTSFLDQQTPACQARDSTYNVDQSEVAIGAGGPTGKGLFQGSQTRLDNVPEQHTDFIFTAVGEQLGFLGGATLLALFCIMSWRILRAAQMARDPFGTLLCVGVLAMLLFQVFENIGMTMGIMPVTGIPLPFVSYGGSSTLAEFIAIGLVLNVHSRRFS